MSLPASGVLEAPAQEFYRYALEVLRAADLPVLLGGAYAFTHYTGIVRHTSNLDLFLRRADVDAALAAFAATGYRAEIVYDHWLAKVYSNGHFVDLPDRDDAFDLVHRPGARGERLGPVGRSAREHDGV